MKYQSKRRDLNPRPPASEAGTLTKLRYASMFIAKLFYVFNNFHLYQIFVP